MSFNKLGIYTNVWNKDNNSLFDYETKDFMCYNCEAKESINVVYRGSKIIFKKLKENELQFGKKLMSITEDSQSFELHFIENISKIENKSDDNYPWMILRHTTSEIKNSYRLNEGNILKLGKVVFKIIEVKVKEDLFKSTVTQAKERTNAPNSENVNPLTTNRNENMASLKPDNSNEDAEITSILRLNMKKEGKLCRICLCEEYDNENPLISVCKCAGTMKCIHLECLKQWLKSKVTTKSFNYLVVHSFKPMECDLCKQKLPEQVRIKDKVVRILVLEKPDNNYIMLESLGKERTDNRYVYILQLKDRGIIRLGRANDADVRMTDISVSRNHAILKIHNGAFYIEDTKSKFGTLVDLPSSLRIIPEKQLGIQMGKVFLRFNMLKGCCSFASRNKLGNYSSLSYKEQIEKQRNVIQRENTSILIDANISFSANNSKDGKDLIEPQFPVKRTKNMISQNISEDNLIDCRIQKTKSILISRNMSQKNKDLTKDFSQDNVKKQENIDKSNIAEDCSENHINQESKSLTPGNYLNLTNCLKKYAGSSVVSQHDKSKEISNSITAIKYAKFLNNFKDQKEDHRQNLDI